VMTSLPPARRSWICLFSSLLPRLIREILQYLRQIGILGIESLSSLEGVGGLADFTALQPEFAERRLKKRFLRVETYGGQQGCFCIVAAPEEGIKGRHMIIAGRVEPADRLDHGHLLCGLSSATSFQVGSGKIEVRTFLPRTLGHGIFPEDDPVLPDAIAQKGGGGQGDDHPEGEAKNDDPGSW